MHSSLRGLRAILFTFGLALPLLLSAADSKTGKNAPQEKKQGSTAPSVSKKADPKDYFGTETCTTCHEDIHKIFINSRHHANDDQTKVTPATGQGCESCHGPGREHVESGGDISKIISFKKLPPDKA